MERKTYIMPGMMVVKLQASGLVCVSGVQGLECSDGLTYGGSDEGYDGVVRTKESSSIWDNEW